MGVVYLAEDTRLHRPVALKFLPTESLNEHDKLRFLNEARAAAAIRHPNICPIHDVEEVDGRLFISMEYLEGETLSRRLRRGSILVEQAVHIAMQIARGLDKAHSLGIVHRDIKSGNVILGSDGHVSILDFGLALLPGAERITQAGAALGTPAYMSPEQCDGSAVDSRTDLWALGVVLFEMLTGTLPFRREHLSAITHAIVHDPVPSLAVLRPEVPPDVRRVVEKALSKKPSERWQSAREMEAALKPFGPDTRAPEPAEQPTMTLLLPHSGGGGAPKSRSRLALIGVIVAASAAAGVYLSMRSAAPSPPRTASPKNSTAPAVSSKTNEKLIAVLPFEVLGNSTDATEIANGVAEILTAALADFERIDSRIAAIPSNEIQRRNINTAAEAKRIYGATWVVSGTAQAVGKSIQFALTLIDPAGSRQLAAKVFEYDPADPVASRRRAVSEFAGLLSVNPALAAKASIGGETETPAASNAYLKGRGFLARYDVKGNLEKAIAQLERAVDADSNFALAHSALGEALWRQSRATGDAKLAAQAIAHGERAVQLDPQLATAHTSLAAIYTTSGRESDAIRELKEAQTLAPGSAEAARELARVYAASGRFDDAERAYREAIAARPTDWYGYLLLGLLHTQRLEYEKAVTAFEQARELTPDNDLVHRNIGVAYISMGRYPEAVSELQRSLKLKSSASTYASLASAYYRRHQYAEAIAAVDTALDLDPKRYYFWGNLGIYCKWNPGSQGRSRSALDKAIELARRFLEVSPNDMEVRADLAEYYARVGNKNAALAQIDRIPQAQRPPVMDRIAIVYELTGNRAKALPLLAAALKNPATWNQFKDDPELAGLWADPAVQALRQGR